MPNGMGMDPTQMGNMMNNPMVQEMMNNPEMMKNAMEMMKSMNGGGAPGQAGGMPDPSKMQDMMKNPSI